MKYAIRYTLLLLLLLVATPAATSQQVAAFFVTMPSELLPTIPTNRRKDMVDFAQTSSGNSIQNALGGEARITQLTSNYLLAQLSSRSTLQLKLLPLNDSTNLIAVVNTLAAPTSTSQLSLYTTLWQPLVVDHYIALPTATDFFTPQCSEVDSLTQQRPIDWIDMTLYRINLSPSHNTLTVEPQFKEYMPQEIYEKVANYLIDSPLTYQWREGRFLLEN